MYQIQQRALLILLSGIILALASCNIPTSQPTPTLDPDAVFTEAAMTVAAELTRSAALTPSPTPTQAVTVMPTATQQPPATVEAPPAAAVPTNTPQPQTGSATAPDAASFVADVTVPDGTGAIPGAVFDKTWRIKNTGTTTWSSAYSLVYIDGERMGSPDSVAVPNEVRPGETVDITVKLTAPTKAGSYQTFFRLRNASGQFIKLDGSGDLWVKIVVGLGSTSTPGTGTPTVTVTPTP